MKQIALYLTIITLGLAVPVHAQTWSCVTVSQTFSSRAHAKVCGPVSQGTPPVEKKETPLINQDADPYEHRSKAWWNALGRQLTLLVDVPYEQVHEVTLQNIIFFANQYGDKVKLNDTADHLLGIYQNHDQEAYRIMAVAALHAIGDKSAMQQLSRIVEEEASGRVQHVTLAALHDHYHRK